MSDNVRKEGTDGPLGWASKPGVFALGINVILGAGVVLKWMEQDATIYSSKEEIILALESLYELGKQTSLHPRWLSCISDLLIVQGG